MDSEWHYLVEYLRRLGAASVILTVQEIEALAGVAIPPTARSSDAFWRDADRPWMRWGFGARLANASEGKIEFVKREVEFGARSGRPARQRPVEIPAEVLPPVQECHGAHTVVLVASGAIGRPAKAPAYQFFGSSSFVANRARAQASGFPWLVVNGLYGVMDPGAIAEPHPPHLGRLDRLLEPHVRNRFRKGVESRIGPLEGRRIVVLGHDSDVEILQSILGAQGCEILRDLPEPV